MTQAPLRRELSLPGAMGVGLGSILGTGAFVALGLAAGLAGPWVLLAIVLAGALAMCNGLSSAQLAAVHPVSGGTYTYGYRFLSPLAGFAAGWLFLIAKAASCAAAALAFGGLIAWVAGIPGEGEAIVLAGLGSLVLITAAALAGLRRSSAINIALVAVTVASLLLLVAASSPAIVRNGASLPWADFDAPGVLEAAALCFVAFTGYGRIATMGEEVRKPRRTIPVAIVGTLACALALYMLVALAGVSVLGSAAFASRAENDAAPLLGVADALGSPPISGVLVAGGATALLAVQLNLVLGLSRVVLAAGREGDLPGPLAGVRRGVPVAAVLVVAGAVAIAIVPGRLAMAWSLSAVAVLLYYALTNAAALRVVEGRFVPRWISALGLLACIGLAAFVDPLSWLWAGGLLAAGLAVRLACRAWPRARGTP
ncbi:MAG: amino acid permease [Planctomycetota bacterium]